MTVLAGYERAGAVGPDLVRVCRIACAVADLTALASSPTAPAVSANERAARITSLL